MYITPVMPYSNIRQTKQNVSFGFVGAQVPVEKLAEVTDAILRLKSLETIEIFVQQVGKNGKVMGENMKTSLHMIDNSHLYHDWEISGVIYGLVGDVNNDAANQLVNLLKKAKDKAPILEELSIQLKKAYKID